LLRALGFVTSQTSHIEAQVVEIQYPDIQYPKIIPIDTSANEWAKSITYFSMNKVGVAGWFHHYAKDIHVADTERQKFEVGVEMADIGYRWSLEEIGQAMMIPGMNLSADRAALPRRAYEEFVDRVAISATRTRTSPASSTTRACPPRSPRVTTRMTATGTRGRSRPPTRS
jgi:hypothetical protein